MCRVSDAGGSIDYSEVKAGAIRKSDLDSNVCNIYFTYEVMTTSLKYYFI